MKLEFLINNVRRDLKMLEWYRGNDGHERVKVEDVEKVLHRWYKALEDEKLLTANEQRFQDILHKEGKLTRSEVLEATELIMFIHRPLIYGRNDVLGVRLQDSDYIRLQNKLFNQPLETNVAEYNDKVAAYEAEIRRKEDEKKEKEKARKRAQKKESIEYELNDLI